MSSTIRRRRLYLAALSMDTAFFCGWAAVPFLVKRGDALALDDADLGTLLAAAALAYVCGAIFGSPVWERRDRVAVTRAAGVACGLGFVLASFAGRAWELFVWLPLGRLGLSAFWPNLMALVGDAPGRTLAQRVGSFNCWWGTGKAAAFLGCGGLLTLLGDPRDCLRVCGLVAMLSVLLVPQDAGDRAVPAGRAAEEGGVERFFVTALAGVFVAWAVGGIWENQFPKGVGAERFGATFGPSYDFWINVLLFSLYGGQAVAFYVLRAWTGWPRRGWTLVVAALLLAASQTGALFATSPVLLGALLFAGGAGFGIFYSQSLYHALADRAAKVRRSGLHEAVLTLGYVIGPPAAGYAVVLSGRRAVALEIDAGLAAACVVATSFLVLGLRNPVRTGQPRPGRELR